MSERKKPSTKRAPAAGTRTKKTSKRKTAAKKPVRGKTRARAVTQPVRDTRPSCIVGIGASAGGLEALEGLIPGVPVPNSMAFVIVQHLAPTYKSIMGTLLAKSTEMHISEITDGITLEPNTVYLNPPNKDVSVLDGKLYLLDPLDSHATRLPIDHFLRSLAEDQNEKAVGIILSGTGSDGSLGLKAIKGQGGMTMAQEEEQAKYDSMPRNAINTGAVDFVLPVEAMGGELARYARHPYLDEARQATAPPQDYLTNIKKIFLLVRSATGHDFSSYKQNTIRRRIERRMAVHQIRKIEDYLKFLRANEAEVKLLFKDLLIGVTRFFRDPEAFECLEERILSPLLDTKPEGADMRVWVPGCASGEEAYSIAILLIEILERMKKHVNVQVFATDIDADAVEFARAGIYPESISADVPETRLTRYFSKLDNAYKIKKQVRETVIFAVQNVIRDPPFSRLDLVSCRNVLIYLNTVAQKHILPMFHYTLKNDGILFLGTSESIGESVDQFGPVNTKWKIFRRKGTAPDRGDTHHARSPYAVAPDLERMGEEAAVTPVDVRSLAESLILQDYAPACVLLNDKLDIVYFQGKTDPYLGPPRGRPTLNILKVAREGLRPTLSVLLHEAVKQKTPATAGAVHMKYEGTSRWVDLVVRALPEPLAPPGTIMVVFAERVASDAPGKQEKKKKKKKSGTPAHSDFRLLDLERELRSTKEYLQSTIEELETSNEELKASNEELQSTNEELQSTNEEMETSKEELQSTNEELETVNAELHSKLQELSRASNDLNNLLASTDIGIIFLDTNLTIARFTPLVAQIYNLIHSDLGRPISDITSNTDYRELADDSRAVLNTLTSIERDIAADGGRTFRVRILPYRTVDNVIDGVVVTFVDITDIRRAKELRLLATLVMDSNDAITVQGLDGAILAWNRGAEKMYGYTEEEALKMNVTHIVPVDQRKKTLGMIDRVVRGTKSLSCQTARVTKKGDVIPVAVTLTKLTDDTGNVTSVATTEREVSRRKRQGNGTRGDVI